MKTILTTLHSKFIHPSLALPCLAAYCGDEYGQILIREFTIHEPRENILAALLNEHPDVIAFSVYIWNRVETMALLDAIHVAAPHIRLILGGPETSYAAPEIWTLHPGISAIVHGEGEQPLRSLLQAWSSAAPSHPIPGVTWRTPHGPEGNPEAHLLANLDEIPSPFATGLMDCDKGFVYYETSRGCPYSCAFCMSALDTRVRSFSMERIEHDLLWLMQHEIPKIKLVDRTFNYNPERARTIFAFILEHNRSSHFHFEIGAHLLDQATLQLLEQVPPDMFQFEIGVQSTFEPTLSAIKRHVPLQTLLQNVKHLLDKTHIHIHLDLIAGLPGDDFSMVLHGIDQLMELRPHHLQIEALKLLPGAPLRRDAQRLGLRFDPNPPYQILNSERMDFFTLERLRGMSRLLDLTWNCGRATNFLIELGRQRQGFATALADLEAYWNQHHLLRFPLGQKEIFTHLGAAAAAMFASSSQTLELLLQTLMRDLALREPISQGKIPDFFNASLSSAEEQGVKERVSAKLEQIRGKGIKLQYFAAHFPALAAKHASRHHMTGGTGCIRLYFYLSQSGRRMRIEEHIL